MRVILFASLLLLASGPAWSQTSELYRSVSPDGTVTFSDRPQGRNVERITIVTRSGTTTRTAAVSESAPASEPTRTVVATPASAEISEQIAQNCTVARDQLESFMMSDRLYRLLPSGEREFLSDEELASARTQAQAQVDDWCNRSASVRPANR